MISIELNINKFDFFLNHGVTFILVRIDFIRFIKSLQLILIIFFIGGIGE